MKFMLMIKADSNYEAGAPPDPRLVEVIGRLTQEMTQAGVLLETGGLLPSARGARVRIAGRRLTVTDGPFAEAKEIVGGYAIVRVATRDDAVEMAKRFLNLHAEILGPSYEGECEIRQMHEA